jgi:hypothetical protein
MIRRLTFVCFAFLFSLVILEGLLRILDPWGVMAYIGDLVAYASGTAPDPLRGYVLAPGAYHMPRWSATVLPDHSRLVPDANTVATCRIVILGDSASFGHGVNDGETWVNLLARQYPNVRVIDAGLDGYNIDNILGLHKAWYGAVF